MIFVPLSVEDKLRLDHDLSYIIILSIEIRSSHENLSWKHDADHYHDINIDRIPFRL